MDANGYKRLLVLHMRGQGRSNKEISEALGYSASYVTELVSKYIKNGLDAIIEDKRTSNNRRMSFEEEATFLDGFAEIAEAGQIITVEGILKEFEKVTGKSSNTSTIYKLLKRHGWRKVKPRPRHPGKASAEDIEASKKLTKNTSVWCWKKTPEIEEISIRNTNQYA
jgi:transposase